MEKITHAHKQNSFVYLTALGDGNMNRRLVEMVANVQEARPQGMVTLV